MQKVMQTKETVLITHFKECTNAFKAQTMYLLLVYSTANVLCTLLINTNHSNGFIVTAPLGCPSSLAQKSTEVYNGPRHTHG